MVGTSFSILTLYYLYTWNRKTFDKNGTAERTHRTVRFVCFVRSVRLVRFVCSVRLIHQKNGTPKYRRTIQYVIKRTAYKPAFVFVFCVRTQNQTQDELVLLLGV